jgi:hypothetical protein
MTQLPITKAGLWAKWRGSIEPGGLALATVEPEAHRTCLGPKRQPQTILKENQTKEERQSLGKLWPLGDNLTKLVFQVTKAGEEFLIGSVAVVRVKNRKPENLCIFFLLKFTTENKIKKKKTNCLGGVEFPSVTVTGCYYV